MQLPVLTALVSLMVNGEDSLKLVEMDCESCVCTNGGLCVSECNDRDELFFMRNPGCTFRATVHHTQEVEQYDICQSGGSYIVIVPELSLAKVQTNYLTTNDATVAESFAIVIEFDSFQGSCAAPTDHFQLKALDKMPVGCPFAEGRPAGTMPDRATVIAIEESPPKILINSPVAMNAKSIVQMTPPANRCGGNLVSISWRYTLAGRWRYAYEGPKPNQQLFSTGATTLYTLIGAWITLAVPIAF